MKRFSKKQKKASRFMSETYKNRRQNASTHLARKPKRRAKKQK